MIVPMRSVFPGPDGSPVQVQIRDNGGLLGTVELSSPDAWARPSIAVDTQRRTADDSAASICASRA